jgi:3-deoxy-manno-octulosonate cytidylyltransferase (CMP-KDO synthetase)
MVVRTWEQATKAITLNKVVVATDDERIAQVCAEAGAEVVMTSSDCANGTPALLPLSLRVSRHVDAYDRSFSLPVGCNLNGNR